MLRFAHSPWVRILLFVIGALLLAATLAAYFRADMMVDFANLQLC